MPAPFPVPMLAAWVRAAAPRCGAVRLVCVDGPAGSGKTTLAGGLAAALDGAPVVHMDDLYEGWAQELGDALSRRVRSWLLDPWSEGRAGTLRRYDWGAGLFGDPVALPPAPVVILEGCASAAAGIRDSACLVVWMEAARPVRLARGLARDGEDMAGHWHAWQQHEQAHFAADGTACAAHVALGT